MSTYISDMCEKIKCVLLIDDDNVTNFYNTRIVNKHQNFQEVIAVNSGAKALTYLNEAKQGLCMKPNLIFLDINMPAMNGWEFVSEYKKLDLSFTEDIKLMMLTTSNNPEDFERSKQIDTINDYINKPLSLDLLSDLFENHYEPKIF